MPKGLACSLTMLSVGWSGADVRKSQRGAIQARWSSAHNH
jgi:hypothetical protein